MEYDSSCQMILIRSKCVLTAVQALPRSTLEPQPSCRNKKLNWLLQGTYTFPTGNWISCRSCSNPPASDLRGESDNIQDVGFGARETQEAMNEMKTLLKEMVGLLRDMNQRQASLGM